MSSHSIQVSQLSKRYYLQQKVGSLRGSLQSKWRRWTGREDGSSKPFWALRDLDFAIDRGDILGVIGRNGAGKSTLLKILSRITEPTSGRVELNGRVASLLEVGTGFHPELTGRENVYLNGMLLGMSRAEVKAQFDAIVDFSGIEPFLDTAVKHYSSGMYVRLAFAVAAHLESEILLIDEVLAVGDVAFQKKCLERVDRIADRGRTILFVSHNMSAVNRLCPNSLLIDQGQLQFLGPTHECIQQYLQQQSSDQAALNFQNRRGKGQVQVEDLQLLDEARQPIISIQSGGALLIQLHYRSDLTRLQRMIFRLEFINVQNELLFSCGSRVSNHEYVDIAGQGQAICHIPRLPLNAGRYKLNVLIRRETQIEDRIDGIVELEVEKGPFYPTGVLPDRSQHFLTDYNWRLE
ncbi:MAG: ABC transporter ATP-binding protein [Bacteroidota bacterium]